MGNGEEEGISYYFDSYFLNKQITGVENELFIFASGAPISEQKQMYY